MVKKYAEKYGVDPNVFTENQLDALTDKAYQGWSAKAFFEAYKKGNSAVKQYFISTSSSGKEEF